MNVIFEARVEPGEVCLFKAMELPFVPDVGTEVDTDEFEGVVRVESVAINLENKGLAWFRVRVSPVKLKSKKAVSIYSN